MILSLVFAYIAGLAKGWMDTLQFHYSKRPDFMKEDKFWNPALSHRNKYKDIDGDGLGDVKGGPAFWLSTTILVAYTDGWHLMQMFFLLMIGLSVVYYNHEIHIIIDFLTVRLVLWAGFKTTYR